MKQIIGALLIVVGIIFLLPLLGLDINPLESDINMAWFGSSLSGVVAILAGIGFLLPAK